MKNAPRYIVTGLIVIAAFAALGYRYIDYLTNPWTRDGQVRANVIQVAPRVSGPIVELAIRDNQPVKAGDLLFQIDPRTFEAQLARAKAEYDSSVDDIEALTQQVKAASANVAQYRSAISQAQSNVEATTATLEETKRNLERTRILVDEGDVSVVRLERAQRDYDVDLASWEQANAALRSAESALLQSEANLAKAQADLGAPGDKNAQLRAARASVKEAELNLEFTQVTASVDGFVTNLELRLGSQVVANTPSVALVDKNSFWIDAYFRESLIGNIEAGQRAIVTLMSYPDTPIIGTVDSLGWGIAQQDGSTGSDLLPNVNPTFEWIRLAQRIPVRVHVEEVPEGVQLRIGTTASVLVRTGKEIGSVVPVPILLQ